jgi:tRNA threonylcarbamoyl adenosine modification protein YeaZ
MAKKYLGWDTSSLAGAVIAFEVNEDFTFKVLTSFTLNLETSRHSERLLWTIDCVLQGAGWTLQDLSGIAVGIGPGSFTGLRIGLTTAKILGAQLQIPLIPFSSLALLARSGLSHFPVLDSEHSDALVIVCSDATKGEWFTLLGNLSDVRDCVFLQGEVEQNLPLGPGGPLRAPKEDFVRPLHGTLVSNRFEFGQERAAELWAQSVEEFVGEPEIIFGKVLLRLKQNPKVKWIAFGQSVERYPEAFDCLPADRRIVIPQFQRVQVAASMIAEMAVQGMKFGAMRDSEDVLPRYLRGSEAEVKLKKGLLKTQVLSPLK